MKKLILKLLFLSLVPVSFLIWQSRLPPHQYTFRAWEALQAGGGPLQYPFMPNERIEMTEVGDLAPYSIDAIPKKVIWQTDENGFRNDIPLCKDPEIILMGDSMAVGTSLTQSDTLIAQLRERTKKCILSLAGGRPTKPLGFIKKLNLHPKKLLIVLVERNVGTIDEIIDSDVPIHDFNHYSILNVFSKLRKWTYWNYRRVHGLGQALLRSRTSPAYSTDFTVHEPRNENPKMRFIGEINRSEDMTDDKIDLWIEKLNRFSAALKIRGIDLVLTLVPNKESIYFKEAQIPEPAFYSRLRPKMRAFQFQFIDLFKPYQIKYQANHALLYHLDDTHWNRDGVKTLVDSF